MAASDLHVDIKVDKFFAPGPIANFLDAFVRGEGALPVTTGPIRGLPKAWRRNYGKPGESRPSLLFLERPDPTTPDSASRNLAAGSILEFVKENNRFHIPSELFRKLRRLVDHRECYLSDYVSDVFEETRGRLVERGCLPKIKNDIRLLVINDEAQILGDQFNGSFQSMSSSDESPRPLLSPTEVETVSSSVTVDIKSPGDPQNKWSSLSDDEDDSQGPSTPIITATMPSRARRAKGKKKIESQHKSPASKTSGVEAEEDDDGITTTPEVPWSLFANKDSILALGDCNDEDSDDDDFCPDKSYGDTDASEDEYTDETEIGGIRFEIPAMHQACESNQYGEMIGRPAQFGKPYLAPGDQERQTADTFRGPAMYSSNGTSNHPGSSHNRVVSCSARGILGASHQRAVSGKAIISSESGIPGAPNTFNLRGITTITNDGRQEMKRLQKRFSGSGGPRERGNFNRVKSRGKISKKNSKGQMSDPDDDADSTPNPSSSEDDDAPNIDMGFGMNTRVFMADGTTKRIKKIQPGEYVLGPDRLPRLTLLLGENTLEIDSDNAALVERAFGRIKIVNHNAVTEFSDPDALEHHLNSHRVYNCPHPGCGGSYSWEKSLRKHMKKKHSATPTPTPELIHVPPPSPISGYTSAFKVTVRHDDSLVDNIPARLHAEDLLFPEGASVDGKNVTLAGEAAMPLA
ncbi:hypothetical protein KVV02_006291 [Mortierella alpina]|uniref:C2H2-type domain-containing protein n=1 Tax=Mortierella alpina TaxID=64518 RepID=A0A9P8CTS9_MORAP|nr:hypothetical protein KVV02_006291 [Mortierella alpina]